MIVDKTASRKVGLPKANRERRLKLIIKKKFVAGRRTG
jgi:hypothetical protein